MRGGGGVRRRRRRRRVGERRIEEVDETTPTWPLCPLALVCCHGEVESSAHQSVQCLPRALLPACHAPSHVGHTPSHVGRVDEREVLLQGVAKGNSAGSPTPPLLLLLIQLVEVVIIVQVAILIHTHQWVWPLHATPTQTERPFRIRSGCGWKTGLARCRSRAVPLPLPPHTPGTAGCQRFALCQCPHSRLPPLLRTFPLLLPLNSPPLPLPLPPLLLLLLLLLVGK